MAEGVGDETPADVLAHERGCRPCARERSRVSQLLLGDSSEFSWYPIWGTAPAASSMLRQRRQALLIAREVAATMTPCAPSDADIAVARRLMDIADSWSEPARACDILQLATTIAARCGSTMHTHTPLFRAMLWKELGFAYGRVNRYAESIAAFDGAELQLGERASVFDLPFALIDGTRALTLRLMRNQHDAIRHCRAARAVFARYGDAARADKMDLIEAGCALQVEEFDTVVAAATAVLEHSRDASVRAPAYLLAAWGSAGLHAHADALKYAERARELYEAIPSRPEVLKTSWVRGVVLGNAGQRGAAIEVLSVCEREFESLRMVDTAILVGLDIAELQYRHGEVSALVERCRRLAQQAREAGLWTEAQRALDYLCTSSAITGSLIRHVKHHVEDPQRVFAPPPPHFAQTSDFATN